MSVEKMNGWLGAVEFLVTAENGWHVENDYGDYIVVGDMVGGRFEKYDRSNEFCGVIDTAAEAVLWLYENNKPDEEF